MINIKSLWVRVHISPTIIVDRWLHNYQNSVFKNSSYNCCIVWHLKFKANKKRLRAIFNFERIIHVDICHKFHILPRSIGSIEFLLLSMISFNIWIRARKSRMISDREREKLMTWQFWNRERNFFNCILMKEFVLCHFYSH